MIMGGDGRARALGIPFDGTPGRWNAITDIVEVLVGDVTLIASADPPSAYVHTGVTALLPRGRDGVGIPCSAGWYSLNGNGEMTGTTWIEERGALTLPVMLTNTHAVGTIHRGVIDWTVGHHPDLARRWLLPVIAETWDGYLNDINGPHIRTEHAGQAIENATSGPVEEGAVGGGTGMNCYEFKAGNGTSSRLVDYDNATYAVGALVQANFGARRELVVAGVPVGSQLLEDRPTTAPAATGAGSVIAIIATDAPLLPGQCKALARRVPLGLARTGTTGSHFSGDIFLAFSTANPGALTSIMTTAPVGFEQLSFVPWGNLDPFYEATVQAVEEAVLNALIAGTETIGRDGHRSVALPHQRLVELLRTHHRLNEL